jgi:hypothetical protein
MSTSSSLVTNTPAAIDLNFMQSAKFRKQAEQSDDIRIRWATAIEQATSIIERMRKSPRKKFQIGENVRAFAGKWVLKELIALGIDWKTTLCDEYLASQYYVRFCEWAMARSSWHIYLLEKECPDCIHPDAQIASASFAGFLISEPVRDCSNPNFQKLLLDADKLCPAAYRAFTKWVNSPKLAGWKHPLLDSWLICIWPIVESQGWQYRDIWKVANQKFDTPDGTPFEKAAQMQHHCKYILKLRIKTPRAGRQKEAALPKLAKLALEMPAVFPGNSPFRQISK